MYLLLLRPSRTLYVRSVNAKSTGGLFGKCVIVFGCAGMICKRTPEFFLDCNKSPLISSSVEQLPSSFIFSVKLSVALSIRPPNENLLPRQSLRYFTSLFYQLYIQCHRDMYYISFHT